MSETNFLVNYPVAVETCRKNHKCWGLRRKVRIPLGTMNARHISLWTKLTNTAICRAVPLVWLKRQRH